MGRVCFAALAAVMVWGCSVEVEPQRVFTCATGPQPVDLVVLAGLLMLRALSERGLDHRR